MAMDCQTLVCDQVKLSRFKIVEWCQWSVDHAETLWHGLIPKEFIQQRLALDLKGILRSLHEWLTSNVPYYHNCLWASSTSSWSNEFSSQMCKCEPQGFLYMFFQQSQACAGSIPESKPKSKISHSLRVLLVTWLGVKGLWKKIRKAQRVFKGYIE